MKKTLFVITTANQLTYTKLTFDSLRKTSIYPSLDILLIDDASEDGTQDYCLEHHIPMITKAEPKGLTHSWNLGYQKFVEGNYDYLIYANNDILIPDGAIDAMLKSAEKYIITGCMSTYKGVGHQKEQAITKNYSLSVNDTKPKNYQIIQNLLSEADNKMIEREVPYINGFFFCLNRKIIQYELAEGILFDPKNINVANEDDLCERVQEPIVFSTRSFVFHYKGVSFQGYGKAGKWVVGRNSTWKEFKTFKHKKLGLNYAIRYLNVHFKIKERLNKLLKKTG